MEQIGLALSSRRNDLNTLVPPYLDSKVHARKEAVAVADDIGENGYLISTYADIGSFVVYDFINKKQQKVNRKLPLKSLKFSIPFII